MKCALWHRYICIRIYRWLQLSKNHLCRYHFGTCQNFEHRNTCNKHAVIGRKQTLKILWKSSLNYKQTVDIESEWVTAQHLSIILARITKSRMTLRTTLLHKIKQSVRTKSEKYSNHWLLIKTPQIIKVIKFGKDRRWRKDKINFSTS